jgi:hypothetical protein
MCPTAGRSGITAASFSVAIGVPTFRLRGVYFSMGTLALAEALRITVGNLLPRITTLPVEHIAEYDLVGRYYVSLGLAIATMLREGRARQPGEEAADGEHEHPVCFFAGLAGGASFRSTR